MNIWLHRYAVFTAAMTIFLLFVGALVTSTGSGLAVPDWPLSFGTLFPPMVGGVFYEHGHRLVAGTVALLTLGLLIFVWQVDSRSWLRLLAVLAAGAVLFQALLGGMTVLLKLPPEISIAHACLAQIFFCLIVVIALVTSPRWEKGLSESHSNIFTLRFLCGVLSVAFFGQLVLGATMRHLGAGLAIPDFPLAFGQIIPPLASTEVTVHFAHRLGALFLTLYVVSLSVFIFKKFSERLDLVTLAGLLVTLVAVQVTLGALSIWSTLAIYVTAIHLPVGALCLSTSVALTLRVSFLCDQTRPRVLLKPRVGGSRRNNFAIPKPEESLA